MRNVIPVLASVLAIAGCSLESTALPVSTSTSGGPASKEPDSSNSLPLGSAVNGPLTPAYGDVHDTRVGPATVAAQSRARLTPARTF